MTGQRLSFVLFTSFTHFLDWSVFEYFNMMEMVLNWVKCVSYPLLHLKNKCGFVGQTLIHTVP